MALSSFSNSLFQLKHFVHPSRRARITPVIPSFCCRRVKAPFCRRQIAMASCSGTETSEVFRIPDMDTRVMEQVADETFHRYTNNSSSKRSGEGTAIVWFRNDMRIHDNEVLVEAWRCSGFVLPVYCIDPRLFGNTTTTHYFGFPKTGALRAQFIMECVEDLRRNLMKRGLNLLVKRGKPEEIIPSLARTFGAHSVYAQKETCSEELDTERLVSKALQSIPLSSSSSSNHKTNISRNPSLQLIWGSTMYHLNDLPFRASNLPDVFTQFRKSVESKSTIRGCVKIPVSLGPPPPTITDWGCIPMAEEFGVGLDKIHRGMTFSGGENAALSRVSEYFWKKDLLKVYKSTRNGMLGSNYSTKFSPWLATGCLSPRYIYEEVKRYEKQRLSNDSTYWVLFELLWRDYFRFLSIKCGNSLFQPGGPRQLQQKWSQDETLFRSWKEGSTGYPLIDANMRELATTGFMSNRGRQIVCSFLVRDMGLDWRMGAEWFETCLLDYDPCSNYGNWTYGAGVGNDPREDRYFSIPKQCHTYDPEGEYVAFWLPALRQLPKERRHVPGRSYIPQIVPLKFGSSTASRQIGRRRRGGHQRNI